MTIKLYYIEGISRIDTPYFATKTSQASLSKQEEFFNNNLVTSVELAYYPPHYRNTIKFTDDDLTFNSQINYLSLEYKDKTYYYFIDSIRYVSETLVEIDITMDVIQTYMFNIYISNGIVERKFINRHVNNKINRNYVRENVSRNEFVYSTHTILNSDVNEWLVFIPVTKYLCLKQSTMLYSYDFELPGVSDNVVLESSYVTYIAPFGRYYYSGKYWQDNATADDIMQGGDASNVNVDILFAFGEWSSHNVTVDMFICPFNSCYDLQLVPGSQSVLPSINIDATDTNHTGNFFVYRHNIELPNSNYFANYVLAPDKRYPGIQYSGYDGPIIAQLKLRNKVYQISIGDFAINTLLNVSFNSRYITQMLDENYIQFTYGSIGTNTSLPLFYLETNSIRAYAAFNPTDGSRIYWVCRETDSAYDKYNTVVIDNNILHYDLKNDPWKDYIAANRGRWAAATMNTVVDLFTKGAYTAQKNKFASNEINDIISNPKSYDRRYKQPVLKNKPANMVKTREQDIASNNLAFGSGAVNSANNNLVSQAIEDYNIKCKPGSPKQIGNISGIAAKEAYIMYYEEKVNDYEQCAQYYHRNGFLVNEYINANSNIFGYVFNRYYFNILKMSLPNVHLHNVIEDEDTIQAISDRLVDGVRLWNVNNQGVVIGDFQYDNVENDYL